MYNITLVMYRCHLKLSKLKSMLFYVLWNVISFLILFSESGDQYEQNEVEDKSDDLSLGIGKNTHTGWWQSRFLSSGK